LKLGLLVVVMGETLVCQHRSRILLTGPASVCMLVMSPGDSHEQQHPN
jgi:hypothetical protein